VRLRVEVDRRAVDPGDEVTGRIAVLDGGSARGVDAWLRFVEEAGNLTATGRHVGPERLADGALEAGQVIPFALILPDDALPNYEDEYGRLGWELVIQVDRPLRPDVVEEVELDVGVTPAA